MNPDSILATLVNAPIRPGTVTWIGLRPARREPIQIAHSVNAVVGQGLEGDRFASRTNGKRQVTLIQAEHIAAVASYLGGKKIDPALLRRNLVTEGINLLALKDKTFRIGGALLEYTGECHPCSRMEENLGTGGYNAMRGHGGITARIIEEGVIALGDAIREASG